MIQICNSAETAPGAVNGGRRGDLILRTLHIGSTMYLEFSAV